LFKLLTIKKRIRLRSGKSWRTSATEKCQE